MTDSRPIPKTMGEPTRYGVMAYRTGGSVFGAASAPLKHDGIPVTYETADEACRERDRLNSSLRSSNVYYSVYRT
jgi:hypothetical protein